MRRAKLNQIFRSGGHAFFAAVPVDIMRKYSVYRIANASICCFLAAGILFAAAHHGQVKFGGLPVPGATVTAIQGDKRLVATTDGQGSYSFPDISDGVWVLQVEMLCFAPARQELHLTAGAPVVDWELKLLPFEEIGAVTVALSAKSSAQPSSPVTPSTRSSGTGRNANSNASIASPAQGSANPAGGFQRTDVNAVNPASAGDRESGELVNQNPDDLMQRATDGLNISGSVNNSATSPFALLPAFGNVRKGPMSLYNASLGLTLDHSALDARPYSFTGQQFPKPDYSLLTGMAAFGGPIRIPRLVKNGPMLTVNYQWTRNRQITTQPGVMPSAAERSGDLSPALNAQGNPLRIFDPATGLQFPGNVIPLNRISAQARALLELYPLPNSVDGTRYNYQLPLQTITHQDSLQLRMNKSFKRNNQLSGNFAWQSTRADNPNLFGFSDAAHTAGLVAGVSWRHTFNARLISTVGYQYSRSSTRVLPFFAFRRNISAEAGINGNNQETENWGPPDLAFAGGISALSDARPVRNRNQSSAISYAMFWNHGRHNFSFGADFRRQQFNYLSQLNPRGSFTFTGATTRAHADGLPVAGTGSDFADFLLGIPETASIAFGNADKYFRASVYDAYWTDDIRIHPGLTMNAGVRWEYGSPIRELYGRLVNLDISPGFTAAAPVLADNTVGPLTGERYPSSLIYPDKKAFQPRIGFAWRPFPASSMVIRGGYGIYYNTSVYTTIATQMAQQAPLSKSLSEQNTPSNPLTLADAFTGSPSGATTTFAVDPHFRVGYAQNWQLSIQRDFPLALVVTATYLGTKGTHGVQQSLPNTHPAGAVHPCPTCPAGFVYLSSHGNSTRHAGQLQLRRRLQNGFTAGLQYTYSKSIDNAALGGSAQGNLVIAQNWMDLGAERSRSDFDQRHLANLQLQYSTGMGIKGGTLWSGWKGRLLKEWTFASQVTAGSGLPLTPIYPAPVEGTGVTGSIRPDRTSASLYSAPAGLFLNPAAYAAPVPGKWGNAGRNSITGPTQLSLNASIARTFRVRERIMIDLRIDSLNVLNHVTFPRWNTIVTSAQFGLPNAANPMRSVQFTLRARI